MKKISTTVKTGDIITIGGWEYRIGMYRHGKIQVSLLTGPFTAISELYSTRALNKLIKEDKPRQIFKSEYFNGPLVEVTPYKSTQP